MSATKKRLPHGTIPFERITDRTVRDTVMKLNENIVALKKTVDEFLSKSGSIVSGGGAEIDVDDELSLTSTNPVQNRVITSKVGEINGLVESVSGRTSSLETGVAQLGTRTSSLETRASSAEARIGTAEVGIESIEDRIPSQATSSNQLADKSFVNSSIATNTAFYISDNGEPFRSLADLENYQGALTNNDYAFVVGTDSEGNTTYTRYKWNDHEEAWAKEYVLNNSSFTSDQWSSISSGITSSDVSVIRGLDARFDAKANDADVVKKNGDQQIAGVKTFNGSVVSGASATVMGSSFAGVGYMDMSRKVEGVISGVGVDYVAPANGYVTTRFEEISSNCQIFYMVNGMNVERQQVHIDRWGLVHTTPVAKGDVFSVDLAGDGKATLVESLFLYAKGEPVQS